MAVDGPVEGVLEGAAVEQPHPLFLRRPPRQVARRGRHDLAAALYLSSVVTVAELGNGDWIGPIGAHSHSLTGARKAGTLDLVWAGWS